ncbi:MAG: hypothetical protein AAF585_06180, partial [Verrucomicrobiota bacterium]
MPRDNRPRVEEPATEKEVSVRAFGGHLRGVLRVAMTLDGRFALTTGRDGAVISWDLGDDLESIEGSPANPIHVSESGEETIGLALTTDGRYAAFGDSRGSIHVVSNPSPNSPTISINSLHSAHSTNRDVAGLAFCELEEGPELLRDLELISACNDGKLKRWDLRLRGGDFLEIGGCLVDSNTMYEGLYNVSMSPNEGTIVGGVTSKGILLWTGFMSFGTILIETNLAGMAPVSVTRDGYYCFVGGDVGTVTQL